ncbi:MAG: discoidin domain-containing protein [Clostridia bacterium]|nr:discoidin domain-containing protein [Clostridia bacterium]
MKKALALLLTLAMLATMTAVPAWAEEDVAFDIPVIEEVTEEELAEVELFAEEVTEETTGIVAIETSESDGITLLTEIPGFKIDFKGTGKRGTLESLYNGKITEGNDLGESFIGSPQEGAEVASGGYFIFDFGEKRSFSGIRVYDSSRTRYFGSENYSNPTDGANRIKTNRIQFSDDAVNWYEVGQTTAVHNEEGYYSDLPFTFNSNIEVTKVDASTGKESKSSGGVMNINARYIRFLPTAIVTGDAVGFEEIVMLDAVTANPTWSLTGYEIPVSAYESVESGSNWGNYTIAPAYDNNLALNSYWHGDAALGDAATDEDRTVTVKFKEATAIGGIRMFPRNDGTQASPVQNGGSMARKVQFFGSDDGENWYPLSFVLDNNSALGAVGYAAPIDYILPGKMEVKLTYLKMVGLKVNNYVVLPEFQIFTPGIQTAATGYWGMDDVAVLNAKPVVIDGGDNYDNNWNNVSTDPFSGVIQQCVNTNEGFYNIEGSDPHMENNYVYFDGYNGSTDMGGLHEAWYDLDLGKTHTFSAIRLFGRWNQAGQSLIKGYLLVSDNGTDWYRTDTYTDSITNVGGMAKYASTGDCYTDIPLDFGKDMNITARYVRIYCINTAGGDHWSWQQAMLVKPEEDNETKTVTELIAAMDAEAAAVETLIAALPAEITSYNEDVVAARKAYDNLPEAAKPYVSEDSLSALTKAEAANAGFVFTLATNANTGLKHATFTMPKRENTTIKSVTYEDTFGVDHDGLAATSITVDEESGNMTITLAGNYTTETGLTGYSDGSGTYYHNDTNTNYGWTKDQQILPEFFTGIFVREVASDGFGDHFVEVTFEDDVTYVLNIKTTPVWQTLTSAAAITGTEYTDEMTPKATWKSTTTNQNYNMNSAFDGKAEYLLRKAGDTTGNRYESDYIAGNIRKTDDTTTTVVIAYKPVRMDFAIDMGEATTVSGVRLYPRTSSYKEDKTAGSAAGCPTTIRYWGSNNGVDWVNLGDYNFTSDPKTDLTEKTADFGENVAYRYYKGSVLKSNGSAYKHTISISEIAFLVPKTYLRSEDTVTVDTSEDNCAVEFEFLLAGGEGIKSFTDASGNTLTNNVDYKVNVSGKQALITIESDYVKNLADGTHAFTFAVTNGQSFTLTLNVKDYSKASYVVSDANGRGTDALVLTSTNGKEVSKITIDGVEATPFEAGGGSRVYPAFTASDDNTVITIPRYIIRKTADLYTKIGLADGSTATVPVVLTYADETTKEYTVTLSADWVATGAVNGTFADDEITPVAGEWKVRTSSANNGGSHPKAAFVEVLRNKKDSQNWHTAYTYISPDAIQDTNADHYIDVDFGTTNVPEFSGVRVTERVSGSTYIKITISGKNSDSDEWEEFFSGPAGAVAPNANNLMFDKAFNYRYMRMQFDGGSAHVTVDTIHLIKDLARLTGDATAITDINDAEAASFKFYVPAGATVTSVTKGGEAVDAANYSLEDGVLTFAADFVGTLGAGDTTLTVTIGEAAIDVTITRKDIYSASYVIVDEATGRGTNDLVLKLPAGKTPTGITYGDKTVTIDPEKIPVDLVAGDGTLTIKRYVIRDLDDIFDKTEIKINVNFTDETSKEYTVALSKEGKKLTGINTEAFAADEIIPTDGAWTITASPSNTADEHINFAFANRGGVNYNWHSAYTETSPGVATKDATTNRLYIDVDFGTETEIAGIRYYERVSSDSGLWNGASVYGKDASGNWVLIKSQAFDVTALKGVAAGTAEVNFTEKVTYKEVRIIVDASDLSTAKAITFLKTIPEVEVKEEEVNIKVTPTTGGNVYIVKGETETPSLGDNVVSANTEVTFKVGNSDQSFFQYWIEANTGKILGNDPSLSVQTTVGKDIKAVFADPDSSEIFVSFYGRDAKSIVSHGYIKKGTAPVTPSLDKLYTTGYEFEKWVDKDGEDVTITDVLNAGKSFYAKYVAKESKQSKITVTNGEGSGTYVYDAVVEVTANAAPSGEKFSHWKNSKDEIVSYENPYVFFAPDHDITLTAVYVASGTTVTEEIDIVMTVTEDSVNGINVASFLTTRIVPVELKETVIETGIIYTKDADETGLTIDKVGATSVNGKAIKVATCDKTASGQYKLTASYYELGIAARGFITYVEGGAVKTVYTEIIKVG